jgi:hypothetical protein
MQPIVMKISQLKNITKEINLLSIIKIYFFVLLKKNLVNFFMIDFIIAKK